MFKPYLKQPLLQLPGASCQVENYFDYLEKNPYLLNAHSNPISSTDVSNIHVDLEVKYTVQLNSHIKQDS